MLIGGILLLAALTLLVVLLARLGLARPSAFERWAVSGVAAGLLLTGGSLLAVNLVESIKGSSTDNGDPDKQAGANRSGPSDPVDDFERQ
jgi:hypothetical protein